MVHCGCTWICGYLDLWFLYMIKSPVRTKSVASVWNSVAKPSFNHRNDHHVGDTKFPNHWCANSCEIVVLISNCRSVAWEVGSKINLFCGYVMRPQFSMAVNKIQKEIKMFNWTFDIQIIQDWTNEWVTNSNLQLLYLVLLHDPISGV